MNGRLRLRISLLLYIVADLLGMLAVGHPTGFGMVTLLASVLVSLIVFTGKTEKDGSQ